jgi:CRP-like cAMP-binding protein
VSATPLVSAPNRIISGLSPKERRQFLNHCEMVELKFGEVLSLPNDVLQFVYLPLTSFISMVARVSQHPPMEVALIGNEGVLGASLVLGVNVSPVESVVQGAGSACRITATQFARELHAIPELSRLVSRYLYALMAQLSQSAVCTHFHAIEARLARWLLMTHDRAYADEFHLTHQFLADMLGVQRGAITIAASALKNKKLIRYTRGQIHVLSRGGLEDAACECYGIITNGEKRLFK